MTDQDSPAGTTRPRADSKPPQFSGVLKPLAFIDEVIARFEAVVLAVGVLIMATVSVANVIGRFIFGESLFFTEELNQFLIVLITFVGLGYAARKGRHIRMSAIYDSLPDIWRKVLMVAIALITAAAPPMSLFMPFIPSAVFSEYPPVSKVTPLPTKATSTTGLPAGS